MKKIICVALIALVCVAFCSCNNNEEANSSSINNNSAIETTVENDVTTQDENSDQTDVQLEEENGLESKNNEQNDNNEQSQSSVNHYEEDAKNAYNDITEEDILGVWLPQKAISVSSDEEVALAEAFGTSYAQYGGSLSIYENNCYEIGMGAYGNEESHNGTFQINGSQLEVTYESGVKDTFYVLKDESGMKMIKAQQGDYFVYFTKQV